MQQGEAVSKMVQDVIDIAYDLPTAADSLAALEAMIDELHVVMEALRRDVQGEQESGT